MPSNSRAKVPLDIHERALGLLAVRPRSRRELERRLRQAGFEATEVEPELERLEAVGLIDDADFARQVVEHELGNRNAGTRAVRDRLREKGIDGATIERTLLEVPSAPEAERALELARSRSRRLTSLTPEKAFGRLVPFLVRRGYSGAMAREAAAKALQVDGALE
jgi:regulatory protein